MYYGLQGAVLPHILRHMHPAVFVGWQHAHPPRRPPLHPLQSIGHKPNKVRLYVFVQVA